MNCPHVRKSDICEYNLVLCRQPSARVDSDSLEFIVGPSPPHKKSAFEILDTYLSNSRPPDHSLYHYITRSTSSPTPLCRFSVPTPPGCCTSPTHLQYLLNFLAVRWPRASSSTSCLISLTDMKARGLDPLRRLLEKSTNGAC